MGEWSFSKPSQHPIVTSELAILTDVCLFDCYDANHKHGSRACLLAGVLYDKKSSLIFDDFRAIESFYVYL